MFESYIHDKQYVVSLDSLDLNFMSQYVEKSLHSTKNNSMLWSKLSNEYESEYYEVTITESEEILDEESSVVSTNSFLCHICNINIPQTYLKQHMNSKKHQSFKKLTEKVLENVSKQINVEFNIVESSEQSDQYYCETCCKVVSAKQKHKHNKTNYHIQSIENQKLIDSFIEIYVDNKKVDIKNNGVKIECYNNVTRENFYEKYLKHNDSYTTNNDEIESVLIENGSSIPTNNVGLRQTSEAESEDDDNALSTSLDTSVEIMRFQHYMKDLIAKYNFKIELPTIEDNSIVIVTPKGIREKFTIAAFHGFKKINSLKFCLLCQKWIDYDEDHSTSIDHVQNIIQPINDNFARELTNIKGWSHCLVCNERILTGSNHAALSPNHKKYFDVVTTSVSGSAINLRKYCNICDRYMHINDFTNHINGKTHKSLQELQTNINKKITIPAPVKNASLQKIQNEKKSSEIYCDTCKVNVPPGGMNTHRQGKPHLNRCLPKCMEKLISPNSVKSAPQVDQPKYTNTQGKTLYTMEEKISEYNKQMAEFNDMSVECLVCRVKVPNLDKSIIEHVEGFNHSRAVENLLEKHKIIMLSIKSYRCSLCAIIVDNFIDHIDLDVDHNVNILLSEDIDKIVLRKYVYDDPLNEDTVPQAYRLVHKVLLKRNGIGKIAQGLLYCRKCDIKLSRTCEIDHMFGERHRQRYSETDC